MTKNIYLLLDNNDAFAHILQGDILWGYVMHSGSGNGKRSPCSEQGMSFFVD